MYEPRVILVTGGCRSGKSSFALHLADTAGGVFLATSPVLDDETADRVRRHQEERSGRGWETVEEETAVAEALRQCPDDAVVLLDCLTLWVNNLVFEAEQSGELPDEDYMAARAEELASAARSRSGKTIMVTNEVGMGIVPDNPMARRFRDLAGRANQTMAAQADAVYLLVSGLPVRIK
ncbi:MAG: bifunctional adenosylcobinamide kinase/adenosylcobinamide-phosphate guanylyltransferase [Planctomycetaceae bacterium]|nr:bifunctional adenosylcobinamide kinase/adenosylcobinamide-phosphate guanylyltransferase [Planctomycetaceae bacterium]